MRIDQVLPSFQPYDAISTDAWLLQQAILRHNIPSDVFSELNVIPGVTRDFRELKSHQDPNHIVIYHHSIGSQIPYFLHEIPAVKIIRFHNITPPQFFATEWSRNAYFRCYEGRCQLPILRSLSDTIWSTSHFNLQELSRWDFPHYRVLPVLRQYEQLTQKPDCAQTSNLIRSHQRKNLLFVGRVVPHKGHHDLFFYLSLYKKFYDPTVRLFCVGNGSSFSHRRTLYRMARYLGLSICFNALTSSDYENDIVFIGNADDQRLASFYRHADVFFNLSDHEGFCVPLVEAMFFGLPVLAQNSTAIPETVADSALLVDKTDPVATLSALHKLLSSSDLNQNLQTRSKLRAQNYLWKNLETQVDACLRSLAGFPKG